MKHVNKLSALVAFASLVFASVASADSYDSLERTYTLPSFTVEGVSDPVLTSYTTPRISNSKIGIEVTMYYTISKKGHVHSIRSGAPLTADYAKGDLAALMTQTLKQWKFEPATNSAGEPVAIKVSMPVKVTAPGTASNAYAGIQIGGMKLVAKKS